MLRLPDDVHKQLKTMAAARGITMQDLINSILANFVRIQTKKQLKTYSKRL